jgi:hypothetical protein
MQTLSYTPRRPSLPNGINMETFHELVDRVSSSFNGWGPLGGGGGSGGGVGGSGRPLTLNALQAPRKAATPSPPRQQPPARAPQAPAIAAGRGAAPAPTAAAAQQAFVFVDNSNLMYGARNLPDGTRDDKVLLNVPGIVQLLVGDLPCAQRVVVGSNIPEPVRARWEDASFVVKQSTRAPGEGEQFVDEALHSCISSALLDERFEANPQVLVLGTGDGNDKEGTNSFPALARAAARKGWRVVVWAWMSSTSPRFFDVRNEFPDLVEVRFLDDVRSQATFRPHHSPPTQHRAIAAPPAPDGPANVPPQTMSARMSSASLAASSASSLSEAAPYLRLLQKKP